jgi:hypothetical protein
LAQFCELRFVLLQLAVETVIDTVPRTKKGFPSSLFIDRADGGAYFYFIRLKNRDTTNLGLLMEPDYFFLFYRQWLHRATLFKLKALDSATKRTPQDRRQVTSLQT